MEKIEIEMYGYEFLRIKFNNLPYEVKLQLYKLEKAWVDAEIYEQLETIKNITKDLLEENGFNRGDWNHYSLKLVKKCVIASEQTQD